MKIKHIILSVIFVFPAMGVNDTLKELLTCNLSHKNIAGLCDVDKEIQLYQASLLDESNYKGIARLRGWIDKGYEYPAVNQIHQIVLDMVKKLDVVDVCELGAGCGKVSKYIYAQNPLLNITCVEHNKRHFEQIKENFETRTHIIAPNMFVKANLIKGCLPNLSFLPSDKYDLVFTCTVMMHLPFIIAIQSAQEIYRLSKRYILHVENKNEGHEWYNMTVAKPASLSPINYEGIDYVALYEKLGAKTIFYSEVRDASTPATYIVYLGEKTH